MRVLTASFALIFSVASGLHAQEVQSPDPRLARLTPVPPDTLPDLPDFVAAEVLEDPDATEPRIAALDGYPRLVLPSSAARALREEEPSFEAWTTGHYASHVLNPTFFSGYAFQDDQAMSAVIGDFNGDGLDDALADGRTDEEVVTFVFLSSDSTYEIHELDRGEASAESLTSSGGGRYFEKAQPGTYSESEMSGDRSVALATDGFIEIFWERASVLHYFTDGEWHRLITSD